MALQRDPLTFRRLKALSMRKRLDVISSNEAGPGLFSMLTPTDLALLFPDYFKRVKPDVSGFRAAISKQSAEQQAAAQGSFLERLSAVEATAAGASLGAAGAAAYTKAGGAGVGTRPQAQLTTEQMAAWNKLQQGALDINSPEGKIFGKLSAAQLASLGISKSKSNVGADVYQYQQPQITDEAAIKRMSQPSGGNIKQMIDSAAAKHGIDPRIMYGIVNGESLHLDSYDKKIDSLEESYGPFQMNKKGGLGNDFQKATGLDVAYPSSLQKQADWIASEIAKRGGGDSARRWVASQWFGYGTQQLGSPGTSANAGQRARLGDSNWNSSWGLMGAGKGDSGPSVPPKGDDGKYTKEQIDNMKKQMAAETTEQGRQQFAQKLIEAGVPTATVNSVVTGQPVSESGKVEVTQDQANKWASLDLYKGGSGHGWCARGVDQVAKQLFSGNKHFNSASVGGHGNAADYRDGSFFTSSGLYNQSRSMTEDEIALARSNPRAFPPGTVVVMGGGKMTSTGSRAGHIQILGNGQWLSDHRQGRFYAPGEGGGAGRVPWNDAHIIIPNEHGQQLMAQNGYTTAPTTVAAVTQTPQIAAYTSPNIREEESPVPAEVTGVEDRTSRPGEPPEATPPVPPVPTADVLRKEGLNPQAVQDIQAQQAGVPPAPPTATPAPPTATPAPPPPPKVSSGSYKLNMQAFREAVKNDPSNTYPGWMIDMASDQDIIDGFNKDARVKAAGVNIADGKLTVKDMSNPEVKAVIEGAQKSGALKAIDQPKPKPETPKPAPEPPKPTATVEQRTSRPGEAPEATPPAPPEPPKPVEGHSDGGSFAAPENINFYKVDKQDDIVAVNPQTQQPIATVQSGETLTRDGNRVDVTPQPKANDAGPVPDVTGNQLTNLVSTVSDALSNVGGAQSQQPIPRMAPDAPSSHPNLIDQTNKMIANQQKFSPSYDRAMHRISQGTEPPGSFNHFSYGNK